MKKIINGRRYDTDSAKEMADYSYSTRGDFQHYVETLYRKSTGEYFLHGIGGPASRYAEAVGLNSWSGGERIMPMTLEEAQDWAEKHLDGDEYEKIFGAVDEDTEKKVVTLSLPLGVIETIKREASKKNMTLSDYVTEAIRGR